MKKLMFLVLALPLLLAPFSGAAQAFTLTADTPYAEGGVGFESGDDCGFVMGTASSYASLRGSTTVALSSVEPDRDQGCIDASGYAYSSSSRESYANFTAGSPISTTVTMDMDWSSTPTNNVIVDQSTGAWSGYARILDSSITPASSRLVWFNWTCSSAACLAAYSSELNVYTNLSTGAVTGYAWNPYYGFISFNGLTEELAPRQIETVIRILDADGNEPDTVDYTNAPLADGYDYWSVNVQFFNQVTGLPLPESEISSLSLDVVQTSDSNVYLNQVEKDGDAIDETPENVYLGCTGVTDYCLQTEDDGSDSFNTYIFSGSPTSNVLADYSDTPGVYYSDRDGCRWIYEDQWSETAPISGTQPKCPRGTGAYFTKAAVFYERQDAFNKYEIDYITLRVTFTDTSTSGAQDLEMYTWDDSATGGSAFSAVSSASGTYYGYSPASGSSDLSFRPRYQITKFVAYYDEGEHTDITEDPSKVMSLRTEATLYDTSAEYQGTYGGNDRPGFTVNYQLDADTTGDAGATTNTYLLMDTDTPPNDPSSQDVEETHRENSIATDYTNTTYSRDYAMGYGQKASYLSTCTPDGLVRCVTPTNVLSSPTAEQWVCDSAGDKRNNDDSCYYTDYLPRVDRHVDPQDMLVIGAINSVIDSTDLLDENYVSVLGTAETVNMRNLMYAQLARYTLAQVGGSGTLDASMEPTGDIIELMNGRLLFAEGDVTIDGSSAFSNKTLAVVGGDVFIDGDITGGQLGLFVVKSGGVGGNVYIAPSVTNVHANIFIDGSLFSYDGVSAPTGDYPTWYNAGVRLETLLNQFYLKGSFVGRNAVNNAESGTVAPWDKGDGTTTTVYAEAQEHDLNFLRQYRRCYPLNADGTVNETTDETLWVDCDEGEQLSEYRDESTGVPLPVYNPFIIEFSPTSDLPLFNVESGLFR